MPGSLPPIDSERGKFQATNRKKIDAAELKKLAPQQRSRYLAYEEPPKHVTEAQLLSKRRLRTVKQELEVRALASNTKQEVIEKERNSRLVGQLKAAEARSRLRIMRLRYQANKAEEIAHLISCQPVALKAVRLQALVPPGPSNALLERIKKIDKPDRAKIEALMEDDMGILTNRAY